MKARTALCALLALVIGAVIAVTYATPFQDGDLFWHMAYAKQMLARGTLRLDHTAFSWTPASDRMIYCAWASELLLYGLWEKVGEWSLFALRYATLLAALALPWTFARRLGLAREPLTYLVLLIGALVASAGTIIKPELFSLIFMALVVWAFFRGKQAAREGAASQRWFWLVPALIALWVNFHGAFILVAPFLLATAAGEGLNLVLARGSALPPRAYRHLLGGWALSGAATLLNPYGWRYPAQLFADFALRRTARPDEAWNQAHRSIFAAAGPGLNHVHLLWLMLALLVGVLVLRAWAAPRRSRVDFTLVLANAAYVPLFIIYMRSTSFWGPVFACSFLFAAAQTRGWLVENGRGAAMRAFGKKALAPLAATACVVLGAIAFRTAFLPAPWTWVGFGNSYLNPVPEGEYLAASRLGPRILNLFDTGGYLLWRLEPRFKVMTDQRSFPYLEWFAEQQAFSTGKIFATFLAAHPADVAVIDLIKEPVWRQFLGARDWKPVYFGPTAAVFVPAGTPPDQLPEDPAPTRFEHLRNATVAVHVFRFAAATGDFRTAWLVADQIEDTLRPHAEPAELQSVRDYRAAHRALRTGDTVQATALFRSVFARHDPGERDRLIQTLLLSLEAAGPATPPADLASIRAALLKLAAPE